MSDRLKEQVVRAFFHLIDKAQGCELSDDAVKFSQAALHIHKCIDRQRDAKANERVFFVLPLRLAEMLSEIVSDHCDRGPVSAGWQSEELRSLDSMILGQLSEQKCEIES